MRTSITVQCARQVCGRYGPVYTREFNDAYYRAGNYVAQRILTELPMVGRDLPKMRCSDAGESAKNTAKVLKMPCSDAGESAQKYRQSTQNHMR
jgi:hypothetical protein